MPQHATGSQDTLPHDDAPGLLSNSRVPETDYADGLAPVHEAYVAAIQRANGHPIAPDAPLYAPNAIAYRGNSYRIENVSFILLTTSGAIYDGVFDPHGVGSGTPRVPTEMELQSAMAAVGTSAVLARAQNGGIEAYAELSYDAHGCERCHAADKRPPACLRYWLPELADD